MSPPVVVATLGSETAQALESVPASPTVSNEPSGASDTRQGNGNSQAPMASRGTTALVLVNSTSDSYADFQRFVKPYLDHFGVPYATLDIATTPVGLGIDDYAVIIIGHRELDLGSNLDATEEGYISAAVNAGTGLVNFDNDLSGDGSTARYQYVNTIFGFGYIAPTSGSGVSFPNPTAHYITQRHKSGSIGTGSMTLASVTLRGSVTAVATTGTQPFLAVTNYGAGHAVQWGSYDWMSNSVKGSMYGLDDLVWRSIVWAARKPFAMQGLPPFVTMRVDDESGNFEWIHIANEFGIKPWAGLFFYNIDAAEAADLSALVLAGKATAAIHAKSESFFYFNHGAGDYDGTTVANNFAEGTAWHIAKNIPISKYVVPHYYEFGTNVFQGLSNWGVEFVGTQLDPGNGYGAPWVMNGPFRLHETGGSDDSRPQYYADFMTIPNHPEFNGRFFNCVTEIRDDAGYEWYPNLGDVPGTIGRGTRQTVRALDAMALPTLFTHGFYVSGAWGCSAAANWRAILAGITANLAPYDPIYVTMDDACRYIRAVHNSDISTAVYDSVQNSITATFTGSTDVTTKFYVFTGEDSAVSWVLVDVPQFAGSSQVAFTLPGPLDHIVVTPNPASVVTGSSQQFTGTGYDAGNNPIPNLHFTWSMVNGGGAIDANGLFTTGVTTGTFTNTVAARFGVTQGFATVTVPEPVLDHFDFATIGSPKYKNAPFNVTVTARDGAGNRVPGFVGTATLTETTGTMTPSSIGPFSAGVWSGPVTIGAEGTNVTLTVTGNSVTGVSNAFNVTAVSQGATSLWPSMPVPGNPWSNDALPLEVGVKFRAADGGYITALRYYKGAGNSGVHVGHLWDAAGSLLASATFTNESSSGWQEVALTPRVPVQADRTYVASYHTGTGYAADRPYFTTGVDSPPLRALRDGEDGGNGVYKYDIECTTPPYFPNQTYQSTNYWVDIVFLEGLDITPPTIDSRSPAPGATGVAPGTEVTIGFSEPMDVSTITTSSIHLRASGAPADVPATVGYTGLTATLTPLGRLASGTLYQVTVDGSVEDAASNPMGSAQSWTFRGLESGTVFETTVADFSDGIQSSTQVVALGDGAVTLSGFSFSDAFAQADGPAANWQPWVASDFSGTPTWQVSSGVCVHDLNSAMPNYHPSILATGFAPSGDFTFSTRTRITQVGTNGSDGGVIGFVFGGGSQASAPYYLLQWCRPLGSDVLGLGIKQKFQDPTRDWSYIAQNVNAPPPVMGQWYVLRMVTSGTHVEVYVDDVLQLSADVSGYVPGRIGLLAYSGCRSEYDDISLTTNGGYAASGSYASNVFDAGAPVDWQAMSWTSDVPAGTTLGMTVGTGNTLPPDGSWTVAPISSGSSIGRQSRYLQYQAALATASSLTSPALRDVQILCAAAQQSVVAAVGPQGACISTAHPCVAVPVIYTRTETTPVRAYSVVLHLSPELELCVTPQIAAGDYLSQVGASSFMVIDRGNGVYEVDETLLGSACGATGDDTLFTVNLGSGTGTGTGTITIDSVRVGDCANAPVPAYPGSAAAVAIDNTAPAAATVLAAHAAGAWAAGLTKVAITFTPPGDGSRVEVYRKGYGNYPQYGTGLAPGSGPDTPTSYPPSGWVLTGVTASGQTDEPGTRDHWYYVAYAIDGCGNTTASGPTGGTLDYLLGDVNGSACAGDDVVNTLDVSLLEAHYGAPVEGEYLACLDVGPTVDYSTTGRPVPDGVIEFEDLVMFALDFGRSVGAPLAQARLASRTEGTAAGANELTLELPTLPAVGENFTVRVQATASGLIQALKLELGYDAAVVEMEGVEAGELLGRQGAQALVLTPGPGRVDVALLGAGAGLHGSGELVQVRFRVKAAGAAALTLKSAEGRDSANRKVALNGQPGTTQTQTQLPTRTWFAAPAPNPFSRMTTLSFALARGGAVELGVYGIDGRKVAMLVAESREAGQYQVNWDGRDSGAQALRPGMYYARLTTPEGRFTRTLVLMR